MHGMTGPPDTSMAYPSTSSAARLSSVTRTPLAAPRTASTPRNSGSRNRRHSFLSDIWFRTWDMVYGGQGRYLKSEFQVRAGADPSLIRVRYSGAGELRIDGEGALIVSTRGGDLREEPPVSYQEAGGIRTAVESRFNPNADGTVSFLLGPYDLSRPLTIDPVITDRKST